MQYLHHLAVMNHAGERSGDIHQITAGCLSINNPDETAILVFFSFFFFFPLHCAGAKREGRRAGAGWGAASPLEYLFSGEKETCYLLITAKIRGAPTEMESAAINDGVATLQDPSLSGHNASPFVVERNDCGRYFGRFSSFEIAVGIQTVQPSGKCSVSRRKKIKDERPKSQLDVEVCSFHDCCKADFTVVRVLRPARVPSVDDSLAVRGKKKEQIDKITSTVAQIDYIKDTLWAFFLSLSKRAR